MRWQVLISSDVMRGFHDLLILSLLEERDSYGYEIGKEIKLRAEDVYQLKETTLYSAFANLRKMVGYLHTIHKKHMEENG